MIRDLILLLLLLDMVSWAQVTLHPSDNVPKIVSSKPEGTTFIFAPGTYRLSQPIRPKDNDQFIGQTPCAPPIHSCPAIISGAIEIGSAAKFDGTNYQVGKQTQKGRGAHLRTAIPVGQAASTPRIYSSTAHHCSTWIRLLSRPSAPANGGSITRTTSFTFMTTPPLMQSKPVFSTTLSAAPLIM